MAWLLLGVDSLIACIAVGPIMQRRMSLLIPFALLFGVGDGGGFLLGSALHWSYPDNLSFLAPTVVAVIGIYWIAVAIVSRKAAATGENPKACGWPTRPPAAPCSSRPASCTWSADRLTRHKLAVSPCGKGAYLAGA